VSIVLFPHLRIPDSTDNIVVRTVFHCAPLLHTAIDDGAGCVRISPSWFTTDEECQIAAAIQEIAHHANYQVESP